MWKKKKKKKGDQSFLYATHSHNFIPIAIKFHPDILHNYLFMVPIRLVINFIKREVTQKLKKEEPSFVYATHSLNLIHIT